MTATFSKINCCRYNYCRPNTKHFFWKIGSITVFERQNKMELNISGWSIKKKKRNVSSVSMLIKLPFPLPHYFSQGSKGIVSKIQNQNLQNKVKER